MADETLERITILLQARDRDFQRAMDRNNKVIARLSRDASRNTTKMVKDIDSRLGQLQSSVAGFGASFVKGLGIGIITTAFAGITTNIAGTIKQVAQIGDEAKRAGLSAQAFQEWKFVAEQNRIGVDQLVDGFKELSLRADEFIVTGAGPAAEAFRRIGLEGQALKTALADPSELMLDILARMEGLDKAAQIRVADELFGGSAGERFVELLGQGETGLRATITAAHEAGVVMDEEMIAKAAELDRRFQQIQNTISTAFREGVVAAADFFFPAQSEADRLLEKLQEIERARPSLGNETADALIADPAAMAAAADDVAALAAETDDLRAIASETVLVLSDASTVLRGLGDTAGAGQFAALAAEVMAATDAFLQGEITAEEFRAVLESSGAQAEATAAQLDAINNVSFAGVISRLGALIGSIRATAAEAAQAAYRVASIGGTAAPPVDTAKGRHAQDAADRARANPTYAPRTSPRPRAAPNDIDFGLPPVGSGSGAGTGSGGGGGGGGADGYARAVESARERIAQWEAEAAALTATIAAGGEYGNVLDYARKKAELLHEAQQAGKTITPELTAEIDALAMAYATAGQNAEEAADKLKAVEDASKRGADALTNIFSGVLSGAKSAREAVADLLMQMAQIQLQKAILGMADGGGFLGGAIRALGGALTPARAGGGPVRAGGAYLVNENTPNSELFVPSRSGGILNVAQAKDALRGGGGQVEIVVRQEPGVVVEIARNEARATVRAGLDGFNRHMLPQRVREISQDGRRLG